MNIIGEHIDYLGGTVLPFACNLDLRVAVRSTGARTDLGPDAAPFVDGVLRALEESGVRSSPIEGEITSTIPVGAGLSSSSALAAALAFAMTDGRKPSPQLLLRAEEIATGVPGGLMDQTAILEGRAGHALLLDLASGSIDYVLLPDAIAFVVIDTGTRRKLADGRYAKRRAEVESGEPKRVRHAESEQHRVYEAVDAIRTASVERLGELIDGSHLSLRDDFEVSSDALDEAAEAARSVPGCVGARLVGAGFAGCVLAVAHADAAERLASSFERSWVVEADDGAGEVSWPA